MLVSRRKALILGSACVCCGARSAASWPGDPPDARNLPSGGCYLLPEQAASRVSNRSMFSAVEESYSTGTESLIVSSGEHWFARLNSSKSIRPLDFITK